MNILAVETSGFDASVALACGDAPVHEHYLKTEDRRHAQTLVAEVKRMLDQHSMEASGIDVVAVSVGPGSFTGLRVGVVFAKTFAWCNNAQLVAVDTLQATSQRIPPSQSVVTAVSDAQRNEVFVNHYEWSAEHSCRRAISDISIVPVAELTELPDGSILTGPALEKFSEELSHLNRIVDSTLWLPSASAVLETGRHMIDCEQFADPFTLEPFYLRRSYAEEKKH